jgi:hypothetical protein
METYFYRDEVGMADWAANVTKAKLFSKYFNYILSASVSKIHVKSFHNIILNTVCCVRVQVSVMQCNRVNHEIWTLFGTQLNINC